jgi:hypothetical protein
MNVPVSKLVGTGEGAPESRDGLGGGELSSGSLSERDGAHREAGFTSVIHDLSLRGWLGWIDTKRSDATLSIRTAEGTSGKIWCSRGKIIDAEWEGHVAEEAVRDMLLVSSGTVTIDFDRVDRPWRVVTPTDELLHVAGGSLAHRVDTALAEAALAASPTGSVRSERPRPSPRLPAASFPPAAGSATPRPRPAPRRLSRGNYVAGALALAALAIAAFAFGRLRASSELAQSNAREPVPMQQTRSGLQPPPAPAAGELAVPIVTPRARELPLIPFVPVEVEPAHAEIWLDRELVGRGRLQLGAIHDGMMHELRFVAPGHETTILFFRDAPPAGRVLLKRIAEDENVAANAGAPGAANEAHREPTDEASAEAEPEGPKRRARRSVAPAPARTRPAALDPSATGQPEPRKPPQVQLIEVRTPRVQVLD